MGKFIVLLLFLIAFFSCKEEKIEFVKSNVMNLILVKNSPKEELELKSEIKKYLENNFPKDEVIYIYMYSYSTSYFIDNEEEKSGMMSSHFLSEYEKDFGIGQFFVEGRCPNQWGELRYYDKYGNFYEPDTIIGKCK